MGVPTAANSCLTASAVCTYSACNIEKLRGAWDKAKSKWPKSRIIDL